MILKKPVQRYIGFSDVLIKELTSSSNKYFIYNMIYNNQLRSIIINYTTNISTMKYFSTDSSIHNVIFS